MARGAAKENVPERILRGAYACFARFGIRKTTVDDVARESGVSRATVYRYFDGKEAILQGVILMEVERLLSEFREDVAGVEDPAEVLARALVFYSEAYRAHEVLQKILETEPELLLPRLTTDGQAILRGTSAMLVPLLTDAAKRGEIAEVDTEEAGEWVARMIWSRLVTWGPGGDLPNLDEARNWVLRWLMPGLKAPG